MTNHSSALQREMVMSLIRDRWANALPTANDRFLYRVSSAIHVRDVVVDHGGNDFMTAEDTDALSAFADLLERGAA